MAVPNALGQAARDRRRGARGDLCGLLRCPVVAARRRSDQSRHGHTLARRGDRREYRQRQHSRGRRHADRAGRIRIAVRIRDIVVRDNEHAVVATAPKAEVRLSGAALLMGRLRAESLNLVDAELAVRITPDGNVTVSTGDTTKPLATGVASKRQAAAGGSQAAAGGSQAGAATDQANAANQAGAATNQ